MLAGRAINIIRNPHKMPSGMHSITLLIFTCSANAMQIKISAASLNGTIEVFRLATLDLHSESVLLMKRPAMNAEINPEPPRKLEVA